MHALVTALEESLRVLLTGRLNTHVVMRRSNAVFAITCDLQRQKGDLHDCDRQRIQHIRDYVQLQLCDTAMLTDLDNICIAPFELCRLATRSCQELCELLDALCRVTSSPVSSAMRDSLHTTTA